MRPQHTTLALALGALALSACGSETGDPSERADAPPVGARSSPGDARPTEVPPAVGPVRTHGAVTVIDDGDGAELCLGGVLESLPPQCGGVPMAGWDWADRDGVFERRGGVRWGDFAITGTFDGEALTPTDVVPLALLDGLAEPDAGEDDPFATPCTEPAGGWRPVDPELTHPRALDRVFAQARRLPGYTDAWMDQSPNPADGDPDAPPEAMNDPALLVVNVRVTGDAAPAERRLREVWGGALCVTGGMPHSHRELARVQRGLDLPGQLGSSFDGDGVEVSVVHDDGTLQAWADREHGAGLVRVVSALVPAD